MSDGSCPLTDTEVVDQYFLEHRAKVLDVAAFLDRIDRAVHDSTAGDSLTDYRVETLLACIAMLHDGSGDRARRIQERLSDQTVDPIDAAPMQGATGAPAAEADG